MVGQALFVAAALAAQRSLLRPASGHALLLRRPTANALRPLSQRIVASDADDDDSVGASGDLGGARRRALRALAGRLAADGKLKTMLVLGVDFTEQFLGKIDRALDECELIKLRLRDVASKKEVKVVAEDIASGRGAHVAQVVGHTALLYRARSAEIGPPRVTFDEAGKAHMHGPSTVGEELELEALDAVFNDAE